MKKKHYGHLTQTQRDRIEALLKEGHTQNAVAEILKVNKSTISREVRKRAKQSGIYDAERAEEKARVLRNNAKYQGMKIETNTSLKEYIIEQLKQKRSPDEIAGRMKREKKLFCISKDAIYKWLYSSYGERYCKYLCTERYKKKPQRKDPLKRSTIPNLVSITKLPLGSKNKSRYGHYEGDTFVSPRAAGTANVAVVVEKKSKFLAAQKLQTRKPEEMKDTIQFFETILMMKSLVLDRGIENRYHEQFNVSSYFCDPHTPSQKPLVEGSIGLLRRWLWKKGTDLSKVSAESLEDGIAFINAKYRKSLGYRSAREVAEESGILKIY